MRTLTLLAALLLAAPVAAQDGDNPAEPSSGDRQVLEQCLAEKADASAPMEACIGVVSDPCIAIPGNDSTMMMGACLEREATLWDERLNDWYGELMKMMDADRKASLKTSQRAWIAMRDSTCAFEASMWGGGTGAGPAEIGCILRETGRRALFLKDQIAFAEQ